MTELKVIPMQREYTKADREQAFAYYRDPFQGNRSLRKTARNLDIPLSTLSKWNKQYDWQRIIYEDDAREAEMVKRSAEARFVNELDTLIDKAFDLAYNGGPQDKTQADMTKYLLGVLRFSPVQKVEQDIIDNRTSEKRNSIEAKEKQMTRDELIARVNAMMEETMDAEFVELPSGSTDETNSSET